MYQNCISSKPIGSVWKIKHDHSDNSGSSLTSVRISSYIDVKFGFLFYLKHSFLRENYKNYMDIYNSKSEDKFIYCCQILLYVLLKPVIFNRTQVICDVICTLFKVILLYILTVQLSWTFKKLRLSCMVWFLKKSKTSL